MRINHNISSMVSTGALVKSNRALSTSLERLSTGLRINRSSDDAAGLAVSENLRSMVRGTSQAMRNAQDGIAALNIAEGAANEISDILQRMRELSIQSSNDTLTSAERGYVNDEYRQLISEIDRIAAVTNYNGMKLISSDGATSSDRFGRVGAANGSALWIDAKENYGSDSITITIETLTTSSLVTSANTDLNLTYLTSQATANASVKSIDEAIDSVNTTRSKIGAFVNRLEHAINNLAVSNTNQQAAESQIRDADFAMETSNYTRNQILVQSGTAMLAQSNSLPSSVLSLIKG